ncbi:MAG: thioredoxin domain-containing protein [Patescibacteria group bacterium]|nr:thioredoxin domain-containing protein [Patescibacteria group bacterium]
MPEETKETKAPKTAKSPNQFMFGLVSGVAVIAVIGAAIFGVMYFKDKKNGNVAGVNTNNQQQQAQEQPTAKPFTAQIAETDHVLGNKDAKVKIFEFSDFQCPYCARFHEAMKELVKAYPNDVAWVFKNFPIESHPLGLPGALAAECAGEQGKFFEMADKIFAGQTSLTTDSFNTFATELGLDLTKFKSCVAEEKPKNKIIADYQLGIDSGVEGTPTSFVNGEAVPGALPLESLKQMVDKLLK